VDEPYDGIAAADRALGRAFPLPAAPLPLARWVDVVPQAGGVEVAWALDDTRPGTPGRLALYAGPEPAPGREPLAGAPAREVRVGALTAALRSAPLAEAQPSLRPVTELCWRAGGLHLRLTGQGPWREEDLVAIAASVDAGAPAP
jgi:hypothetical protein